MLAEAPAATVAIAAMPDRCPKNRRKQRLKHNVPR